ETVLQDFHADSASRHSRVLDASPLPEPLVQFVCDQPGQTWTGLVAELLRALNEMRADTRPAKGWPRDAIRLSGALQRIQTALRAHGLRVEFGTRTARGQPLTLTWREPAPNDDPDDDPDGMAQPVDAEERGERSTSYTQLHEPSAGNENG